MKKCPWCGQKYPDEVSVCAIDQSPLESGDPMPAPTVSKSQEPETDQVEPPPPSEEAEDTGAPDGFRLLGAFDAFEADRLLKRFSEIDIRFEINRIERREQGRRTGFRTVAYIQIFIHADDYEKANQILTADWKV
jgi:hypothetical protein